MIRQYIKLFLESNEESQKKRPTFREILSSKYGIDASDNQEPNQEPNQDSEENVASNDNTFLNPDEIGMAWKLR